MRRIFAVVACTAAVVGVGAGSAFAGEITGNGKWIAGSETAPLQGKSECAYSGVNDNFVLGNDVPDADGFTRTQSWGQVARQTHGALGGVPGTACNPIKSAG
jgi:hypothetical protein